MPITKEQAIEIMIPRGYQLVSEAGNGTWVAFAKDMNGIWMHSTVYLERESCTMTGGVLKLACTLRCESVDVKSKRFDEFENTLYIYSKVCSQLDELIDDAGIVKTLFNKAIEGVNDGVSDGVKSTLDDRILKFKKTVIAIGKEKGYSSDMCKKFFEYWSETNADGKKMRWEIAKTKSGVFNIGRRMVTWNTKDSEYSATFKDRDEKKADKLNNKLKEEKQSIDPKELF